IRVSVAGFESFYPDLSSFLSFFSKKNTLFEFSESHAMQGNSPCFIYCTFTGKEKDVETGYGYFGARYMDHELMTMWLSVDPMADKYPSISPYAYCAWNPVRLIDLDGRDLFIPDKKCENHGISRNDILSLVRKKNRKYIQFDENGKVHISCEVTEGKLKMDKGLALIYDMVYSDKLFFYESNDDISSVFRDEEKHDMSENELGVINASKYGKDSNHGYTHVPKEGFDGHVILARSGEWLDGNNNSLRISLLFHELSENYYRTHCGMDYEDAHHNARMRESVSFGNNNPGYFYKCLGVRYIYNGQTAQW
ncbi:MAG: RHS repeat-associated core domain-containing protein, partial [Bacteroidales bacterium]|nr:RHS repeat-associated core domain-containing protein [Bacteroidales bacterium]